MATNDKDKRGRPDLDLDFTFHATDKLKHADVSKKETFEARLEKADHKFVEDVRQARRSLNKHQRQARVFEVKREAQVQKGNTEAVKKIDRQITHNKRMIASREQELQVGLYVGRKGESMDAVNKLSKSGKGRTDVVTDKTIIESTTAKNKKKSRQLEDHKKLGKATDKKVLLDAPNMQRAGTQHAKRKGVDVANSRDELHKNVRAQYRVIKDDPARLKAAQDRNAAKKAELAAKAAKTTAKTHTTDKSKAARQEIKAKVNVLRGRKIFADLSGDRQKKIDAKKTNTEEVKQLRAAQHEKIRARTKDQTVRQSEAQTEQRADRKTVQERKVEKSHQSGNDRFKKVEQRAYDRAKARGADDAAAKKAGEDRVNHVKAKMELNAERQELKDKGQKLSMQDSKPYFEREMQFREGRQRDLADQARREDRPYQGPPAKDNDFRQMEMSLNEKAFRHRTRLDGRLNDGQITPAEHKDLSQTLERQIAEFRQNDLARYYGQEHKNDHHQTQNQGYGSSYSSSHSMRR